MSAAPRVVGVLPALGSGLTDLRRTGQHQRLIEYDLRAYAAVYDRVLYFSYFRESLQAFTRDPLLLERVTVLPRRGRWPARLYALLLPLVYRSEFRQCQALRVLQFPGVIPALVARALHRTPVVVTYGYDYAAVARIAGSRVKPWLYRWLERVAFPRAAAVIVTSREMEARLARHPARPRLAYFPNGVDTAQFAPLPSADAARSARTRPPGDPPETLATPGRRPTVLYAGRLEPEKNVARLVEALATLRALRPRLVVVGDGSLRETLERQARAADVDVTFAGVVEHGKMPRLLAGADCFVLPSLTEGNPKVLIEAMASGMACAASARGGIPSMLADEESGLLFDPEDVRDIARAIERLLRDDLLARRLGASARAAAVARHDARVLLAAEAAFVQRVSAGAPEAALVRAKAHVAPSRGSVDSAQDAGAAAAWHSAETRAPRGSMPGDFPNVPSATERPLRAMFEDYARDVPMDGVVSDFVARRLRDFRDGSPMAILDLGAGDGRYLSLLASLYPGCRTLVGCELSLIRARRIKAQGFRAVVARAEALPFRAGAFDLVTMMEVIEHLESPALALDEVRRTLGPDGRCVVTTPNYPMKRLFDVRAAVRQRSLARLRDDPTHISPLSAGRLERLLRPRFAILSFEGTAIPGEGHLRWLGRWRSSRAGRHLSNKLFALCAPAPR